MRASERNSAAEALSRIDTSSMLFFLGILLAVGALATQLVESKNIISIFLNIQSTDGNASRTHSHFLHGSGYCIINKYEIKWVEVLSATI